jgi:hypothetical protein
VNRVVGGYGDVRTIDTAIRGNCNGCGKWLQVMVWELQVNVNIQW